MKQKLAILAVVVAVAALGCWRVLAGVNPIPVVTLSGGGPLSIGDPAQECKLTAADANGMALIWTGPGGAATDKIEVYEDAACTSLLPGPLKLWDPAPASVSVWVKGVKWSDAVEDIHMSLEGHNGTTPAQTIKFTVRKWVKDVEITMGGSYITQTSPSLKNLHYGGTGSPELAKYKLVLASDAKDMDKDELLGDVGDAGLDTTAVTWTVEPGDAGTISGSGLTAEFKPGNVIKSNIKIKASIKEGKKYSYYCGSYDPESAKVTIEGINTYYVGVILKSDSDQSIFEDSTSAELIKDLGETDFNHKIDTGWWDNSKEPGIVKHDPRFPDAAKQNYEWLTVARTDNADLTAINGKVKFVPGIVTTGKYRMTQQDFGMLPPGSHQLTVVKTVLALVSANPYVGAALELVEAATDGWWKHTWEGAMYGQSVIEWVAKKEIKYDFDDDTNENAWQDFSTLTVDGTALSKVPNSTVRGSVDMQVCICVNDDSSTSASTMEISRSHAVGEGGPEPKTSVKVKCGKPTWDPPSP